MTDAPRPLGPRQIALLEALGGFGMRLVLGTAQSRSLVKRGLLMADDAGDMARMTAAGYRALAEIIEARHSDD